MPLRDVPEVFGQHASADAAMHALEASALLSGLAAMQRGPPAVIADGASSETRLLAITAVLLKQAQPLICRHWKHSMAGAQRRCMSAKGAFFLSNAQQHVWRASVGPHSAAERSHDQAGPQVPDAPELDAAVAAAATPRSGGMLLQAVLVQELELHASLAARVRRDATALERVLGGRTANTKGLADCAEALLAGQARPPETLRDFPMTKAGSHALVPPRTASSSKESSLEWSAWTGQLFPGSM